MSTMFSKDPEIQKEFGQLRTALTVFTVLVIVLWTGAVSWITLRLFQTYVDHQEQIRVHQELCNEITRHHPDFHCPKMRGAKE